jgi:hypothetical protein
LQEENRILNEANTPEDLFGLLGIFPNKKKDGDSKGMGKGKRSLGEGDDIVEAFNDLSNDDRKLALQFAEEGNAEELFGLLGIFPNKKKDGEESKGKGMMGKRSLETEDDEAEDLFGLLGIFPNKKKDGESKGKGMMGKRSLETEEDEAEDLFGLLGIFPNKKKDGDESKGKGMGMGKRDLESDEDISAAFESLSEDDRKLALQYAEEGNQEELFGLLGIFPNKKKDGEESKGKGMMGKRS